MESSPEQAAEGLAIVRVLAAVLERLVCANASVARGDPGQVTKFHALKAPGIGILQYLERIHKYASCSSECFILALIYIDRLIQRNNFLLTELNVHRVVITAVLLAAKFFDDAYYNNAYYAKVGGVLVSEMNGLEVDFLFRINFSLHATPELFEKYRAELLSHSTGPAVLLQPVELSQAAPTTNTMRTSPVHESVCAAPAPSMTFPSHHETIRVPSQITPSPPRVAARTAAGPLHVTATVSDDMVVADVIHNSFPVSDFHMYSHSIGVNYLQRANSCPAGHKSPSFQRACHQPQPFSAPPMVAMLPGGMPLQNCVEPSDPYVMVDNQIFPLQNTLVHHHHTGVDVGDLLRQSGVATGYHQRSQVPGAYITRDVVGGQRFVDGRMLAQVSGGL